MSSKALKTSFLNVQVVVEKVTDPATGTTGYRVVSTNPQPAVIINPDTILNYQLVAPSPSDAAFTGMTINPPSTQFSTPTISTDGKNLTLSDVNTQEGNFTRTFLFNGHEEIRAMTMMARDPDIENRPPPPPPPPSAP